MGDLAVDLRIEGRDGAYVGSVSADWVVWTPNGGFLASLAVRAAGLESPGRRPAVLSCHFLNVPEIGEVDIAVTPLRASRRADSMRVSVLQRGRPVLEALVWTVEDHDDGLVHTAVAMPEVPPPQALTPWTPRDDDAASAVLPLWRNIDARMDGWPEGQQWELRAPGPPERREWCRFRPTATFEDEFVDAARAVILIDTLMFPAALMTHVEPMTHIAPSMDLTVWFHRSAVGHEWLLCEASSPLADAGLVAGAGRIWTQDGRLVASGGQHMLTRRVLPDKDAAVSV